jgi:plastocyanin
MRRLLTLVAAFSIAAAALPPTAQAADDGIVITIKDHKFSPSEVKIPAGKRVVVTVVNDDPTPEEFESKAMKVEKIIPGKSKATVRIGPLEKGRYNFFGEFNEATAQGWVVVD